MSTWEKIGNGGQGRVCLKKVTFKVRLMNKSTRPPSKKHKKVQSRERE